MTVYATRLVNGTDTRERMRRADAMHMFPAGAGMARGGFRPDGGGVVSVNAGTMTVSVSPFTAWVDGGVSDLQGGYTFVCDATETLTLAAGHATLSRTDVVIAEVRDTTHDGSGSTDARVRILEGTPGAGVPALPTNALALRNITVGAGLSAGTGGLTSGNLSTDRRTYTTGLGGVLTVASQAERDATGAPNGAVVYRSDTDRLQVRRATGWQDLSGGAWGGFTPTLSGTGTTQGNVTFNVRSFTEDAAGNVDFYAKITLGTTTVLGSLVYVDLPVPLHSVEAMGAITAVYNDASGNSYAGSVRAFDTAKVLLYYGATLAPVTSTVPFTWAATDSIEVRGRYRRA